jgi:nitrogen fixation protein NifZ
MKPAFEYGDEVRLIRNVRNDGTYPGMEVGELLIRRGSVGCVYDVGTYLQDQLIYRVHFLDQGRTVGCREEELVSAAEAWVNNRFEFREPVIALVPLKSEGHVVVEVGDTGEIARVIRDDNIILYHARFHGRTFQVPEAALDAAVESVVDADKQEVL